MRVIEDACADPPCAFSTSGPGDAAYKQQFSSNRSRSSGTSSSSPRASAAVRINATRTAILAPARLARLALDAARPDRSRPAPVGERRLRTDEGSRRRSTACTDDASGAPCATSGTAGPLGGTMRSRYEHLGAYQRPTRPTTTSTASSQASRSGPTTRSSTSAAARAVRSTGSSTTSRPTRSSGSSSTRRSARETARRLQTHGAT